MLEIFHRLVERDPKRTEAEIQADVRQFILSAPFELEPGDLVDVSLEAQVGDRRRIDVEAGSTVIEVKRDLRREKPKREAEEQLAGYVEHRMHQTGFRYVGVLTDGTEWNCYDLVEGKLRNVSQIVLEDTVGDANRLIVWLEGVLATTQSIPPTADNIEQRLGARSSAYQLDRSTLATLYEQHKDDSTVAVKRKLWAKLLLSALGTQFKDEDHLFIDHTLLVNTSEIIAHAVLGLHVHTLSPTTLLSGERFAEAGVYGVVESDFFDWVLEVEGGPSFIKTLAKRLNRFVWGDVDQDVLKILYENVIGAETRKRLGEYYTPAWLAEVIVEETIKEPLKTRVLDPACGSGTFLFHAVRNYIAAAEAAGQKVAKILTEVTRHVIGMDLHPVAVTLARVTYLLAVGRKKLTDPKRGNIQIPVYLGDAVQWREQGMDLWSAGNLIIQTEEQKSVFASDLTFPDALLDDSAKFDQLVTELADKAGKRNPKAPMPSLKSLFTRLEIAPEHHKTIEYTFAIMCQLHDEARNHIWGYYVRNLARPLWLSKPGNQVDMIIGNPPWLAYSYMPPDMQKTFRTMSEQRELWAAGAQLSPHHDLSALFVVRACELYLRKGGHFALILPNTALDREHYAGFRTGKYSSTRGEVRIAFEAPWDLRRIRPHFFPRAASVVFGTRTDDSQSKKKDEVRFAAKAMPEMGEIWTGKLEVINAPWKSAVAWLKRAPGRVRRPNAITTSPYHPHFTQGAIFAPHLAFVISELESSPLGLSQGRVAIQSQRSVYEKKPWKVQPTLSGVVEQQFIRPFFTGDNVFPFRIGEPLTALLPCDDESVLSQETIDLFPGLQQWWAQASQMWETHRSSERLSLMEQLDFQSKLSKQLPIPAFRILYNTSGMHICSSKLRHPTAIITSGLYWAPMNSEQEADFLCAILNAPITTELTRPLMSYGKDERHIHKHVWDLPIPSYDRENAIHRRIAELAASAEKKLASLPIDETIDHAAIRRHLRKALDALPEGPEINELVFDLIA